MVPRREALLGSTFETRNTSSRRPAIASAMMSSASPYISAVSMWVMPRSRPRCSAATARLRSPWSRYQVPCPITETLAPVLPKGFVFMFVPSNALQTTDVRNQHAAGRRLRDIEPILLRATDGDIGAVRPRAGLDPRDQLTIRCEYEDMAERGVADEQAAARIH